MGYIPGDDLGFNQWVGTLVSYVTKKTDAGGGTESDWKHIPQKDVGALQDAYLTWRRYFDKTNIDHTPADTKAKNDARKNAEQVIRPFVQRYLHWEPVTNFDRVCMSIPNRDTTYTPHVEVHEEVELDIDVRGIRKIIVHFRVKGSSGKAKPDRYDGAVIVWDVLDEPPHRPEQLKRHVLASRTPKEIVFDETERGKTVYVAAAWQNKRGNCGQWSEIHCAFIP